MAVSPPMAVVETEEFLRRARVRLSEAGRSALIAYLAANPEEGQGNRDWGSSQASLGNLTKGKETGGVRVIYYYFNQTMPLFALDIYAKNEKSNLSEADKSSLKRLLPVLVSSYAKERKF